MEHQSNAQRIGFGTIRRAVDGDPSAINQVVKHYQGYISKLSKKKLIDQNGIVYECIDNTVFQQLETKLITKILLFKLE